MIQLILRFSMGWDKLLCVGTFLEKISTSTSLAKKYQKKLKIVKNKFFLIFKSFSLFFLLSRLPAWDRTDCLNLAPACPMATCQISVPAHPKARLCSSLVVSFTRLNLECYNRVQLFHRSTTI